MEAKEKIIELRNATRRAGSFCIANFGLLLCAVCQCGDDCLSDGGDDAVKRSRRFQFPNELIGVGGNGSDGSTNNAAGSGGGGGAYVKNTNVSVSFPVTVSEARIRLIPGNRCEPSKG